MQPVLSNRRLIQYGLMQNNSEGLEFIDPPRTSAWLDQSPEPLANWFRNRYGEPTEIQRAAWSRLSSGQHLLLSAPTGTGKTLAAFLPLLAHLFTEHNPRSAIRNPQCLYVSPLKALSNDTHRTLTTQVEELAALLSDARAPRLMVRSGDSTAAERRELRRNPPEILLTTPESVAVLLSQPMSRQLFAGLRWVVVDEVHALAACKRGADFALSLERLTQLAEGRLQRIGLSATATPLSEAARWLVGAASRAAPRVRLGSPDLQPQGQSCDATPKKPNCTSDFADSPPRRFVPPCAATTTSISSIAEVGSAWARQDFSVCRSAPNWVDWATGCAPMPPRWRDSPKAAAISASAYRWSRTWFA